MASILLRRGGSSFWAKAAAAAALIALGDRLFYVHEAFGSAIGAFALVWLVATLLVQPALRRNRGAIAAAAAAALYAFALFDDPGLLAWTLFCAALATAVLLPRARAFDNVWRWTIRLGLHGVVSALGPLLDLNRLRRVPLGSGRRPRAALPMLVLPIVGGAIFLTLFALANPLIGNALSAVRPPALDEKTLVRLLLWGVLLTLVWSSLRPRRVRWLRFAAARDTATTLPGVSVASVTLSLLLFNALFALQNGLDIAFLWSGAGLPQGVTMADYVHRGAYPLIATALLAGVFVLVALRPGSATADAPLIRRLVTLWVGQNIFLVASSMLRTRDYIVAFSLTQLRIAALLWMGLVAVGLALILWRMLRAKSAAWLINVNAAAAGLVLSVCTVVDLGAVAAHWNVRHAREVGGRGSALDLCYLERLGSSSLTALAELERRKLQPAFRERVAYVRRDVLWQTRHDQDGNQWTWRNARRIERAYAINGVRPWPRMPGRDYDRGCDGGPASVAVPTFTVVPPTTAVSATPPPLTPPPLTSAPQR